MPADADFDLTMYDAELLAAVRVATEGALYETVDEVVRLAKEDAPVDTGALRDDLQVVSDVELDGDDLVVAWGAPNTVYGLIVELIHPSKRGYMMRAQKQAGSGLVERAARRFS